MLSWHAFSEGPWGSLFLLRGLAERKCRLWCQISSDYSKEASNVFENVNCPSVYVLAQIISECCIRCICELLGSWITCLQCLLWTVQSIYFLTCVQMLYMLVNNLLKQHFCLVRDRALLLCWGVIYACLQELWKTQPFEHRGCFQGFIIRGNLIGIINSPPTPPRVLGCVGGKGHFS